MPAVNSIPRIAGTDTADPPAGIVTIVCVPTFDGSLVLSVTDRRFVQNNWNATYDSFEQQFGGKDTCLKRAADI